MSRIGYVVVEYNQASGRPSTGTEVHDDLDAARAGLRLARAVTSRTGREERYQLAELVPLTEET